MPVEVQLPDNSIAEFPDSMSRDEIKAALQKKFPSPTQARPKSGFDPSLLVPDAPKSGFDASLLVPDAEKTSGLSVDLGKQQELQQVGREAYGGESNKGLTRAIANDPVGFAKLLANPVGPLLPRLSPDELKNVPPWLARTERISEAAGQLAAPIISPLTPALAGGGLLARAGGAALGVESAQDLGKPLGTVLGTPSKDRIPGDHEAAIMQEIGGFIMALGGTIHGALPDSPAVRFARAIDEADLTPAQEKRIKQQIRVVNPPEPKGETQNETPVQKQSDENNEPGGQVEAGNAEKAASPVGQVVNAGVSQPPQITEVPVASGELSAPGQVNPAISIKNAWTDVERREQGFPEASPVEKRDFETVRQDALKAVAADPLAPERLTAELAKKPRSVTDTEDAVLLHRFVTVKNQLDGINDAINAAGESGDAATLQDLKLKKAVASDEFQQSLDAVRNAGTATARGLNARKMLVDSDFSLSHMEATERANLGGAPLTEAQAVKVKAEHDQIVSGEKAHTAAKVSAANAAAAEAISNLAKEAPEFSPKVLDYAKKFVAVLDKRADAARIRLREKIRAVNALVDPTIIIDLAEIGASHLAHGIEDFAAWSKKMTDEFGDKIAPFLADSFKAAKERFNRDTSASPEAKKAIKNLNPEQLKARLADEARQKIKDGKADEVAYQVNKLARQFIAEGIKTRDELVSAIHAAIGSPDLSLEETRDALSGYGKFQQLSKDQISVQLRDIKGQLQQVSKLEDLEAGKPPAKSGFERREPSAEERKLIKQVEDAKKKYGIQTTDPATQLKSTLDSIKTRLRHQIEDYDRQIAAGSRDVKGKRPSPSDAESEALKAKRDAVKSQFEELFGKPEMPDDQRLAIAKRQLEKSIDDLTEKLRSGDFQPKKQQVDRPARPELEELKQKRDELQQQLSEARKKTGTEKEASRIANRVKAIIKRIEEIKSKIASGDLSATKSAVNRPFSPEEEQARQQLDDWNAQLHDLRHPEKSDLDLLKERMERRILDLQDRMMRGDYAKRPRVETKLDRDAEKIKAENDRVKKQFRTRQLQYEMQNRTTTNKVGDWVSSVRKFAVLSGVHVLGKLAGYSLTKIPSIALTEMAGAALSKLPYVRDIAARAPSEGGGSLRQVALATAKGITQGWRDAYDTMRKGESDLKAQFSDRVPVPREWFHFFQILHEVEKSPLRRAAFELSFAKRLESAARNGVDTSDELVRLSLAKDAYIDSDRALLLSKNQFSSMIKGALKRLEAPKKSTGKTSVVEKTAATAIRYDLPVLDVAANFTKQSLQHALGLFIGIPKVVEAIRNGVGKLDPKEADSIIRQLKYGTVGGAFALYGFYDGWHNGDNGNLGGYYQPGEKRRKDQAGVGGLRVFGHNISGVWLHNPLLAVAQLGHTIGAVARHKFKSQPDTVGIPAGVVAGFAGLLQDGPTGRMSELLTAFQDPRRSKWALGEMIKNWTIPQGVQEIAQSTDRDENGEVKRNPKTITQHVETGIPGLRENVPRK